VSLAAWALDPALVHLNHGSFGGCPRAVLAAADALRAQLESAPMRFFTREWQPLLDAARARIAAFVHADPAYTVFVASATTGVATALAALAPELATGDELLVTSHAYRACKNQLARIAGERGARVVVAPIALPFDADACTAAILAAATPRTRIALLDHVTSPTALVFPLARLVPALATRGIHVVIDGAHAPGQIDVDVTALLAAGVTYYTGNHHKWICGPKASAFLVAAPAFAARTHPLVTSHGASREYGGANRFHAEHDWTGTHDPTAHLAVPAALDALDALGGGWPAVRARNHALAVAMRDRLADALHAASPPLAPADAIGAMAALPITTDLAPLELQARLLDAHIEAPIVDFPSGPLLRVSAHLYNTLADLDPLLAALARLGVRAL
jgi:isopenicillin-N epimerase